MESTLGSKMSPTGQDLFEALHTSLADFRGKVEGAEGRRVAVLGSRSGILPELIRRVLGSIADVLTWLGSTLHSTEATLRLADAVIALLELADDMLKVLGPELSSDDLPADLRLDPAPLKAVIAAVEAGNAVRTRGKVIVDPSLVPEDLTAVREELERLLGNRVNPSFPGPGSLGKLLSDVQRGPEGA